MGRSKALIALARRPRLIREGLRSAVIAVETKAKPVFVGSYFPATEDVSVDMGHIRWKNSNMDPFERYFLGALCQIRKPRCIFEIGTYDGTTTLLIARNAPQADIFTLDLPQDDARPAAHVSDELEHVERGNVGSGFAHQPEGQRITQLFGDSRTFDFTPWTANVISS
jgi:hypothetical protein